MAVPDPQTGRRLATRPEVCEHFRISNSSLDRLIADGRIVAYRVGRRAQRFDLAAAEAALLDHRTTTQQEQTR